MKCKICAFLRHVFSDIWYASKLVGKYILVYVAFVAFLWFILEHPIGRWIGHGLVALLASLLVCVLVSELISWLRRQWNNAEEECE